MNVHLFCIRKTSSCSPIMFTVFYLLICFQRGHTFSICLNLVFEQLHYQFQSCKKIVKKPVTWFFKLSQREITTDSPRRNTVLTFFPKYIYIARLRTTLRRKFESPFYVLILHILANKFLPFEFAYMLINILM